MAKLNAMRLRTLTKPGAYGDCGELYLQVRGPENRSSLCRFKLHDADAELSIDGGHVRPARGYQVRSFEVMPAQVSNDDGKRWYSACRLATSV